VGNSYILLRPIGQGATGTVWRAVDRTSGEQVAVKLLREHLVQQPRQVTRFVQERAILLMLRHEHIVRVRDLLTIGDSLGLVMDLVEGGSLREYLDERGSLAVSEAARLLGQVAAALAEAHRLGVVHRDLKPDNILVHCEGGRRDARLTDFGIARVLEAPGLTTPEALIGTPNYLAPEAINGARPSPAGDVYGLGVLLYELIVGRAPYVGGPAAAVLRRHIEEEPQRYPGIPDIAWALIESCMDKDPKRRPAASELVPRLHAVQSATAGVPALVVPGPRYPESDDQEPEFGLRPAHPSLPHRPHPSRRPRNRVGTWRWAWSGAVVALIATALVLSSGVRGFDSWRPQDSNPPPGAVTQAVTSPHAGGTAASSVTGLPAPAPAAGSASRAAPPGVAVTISVSAAHLAAGVRVFGPWQCSSGYQTDSGHPVLAKPCYAVGGVIRVVGHTEAPPGVQADVSMTIQDAGTGRTVAGPYTCPGLMFTDSAPQHDCGPADLDAPHGHRYVVVQSWQYTGRTYLPSGSAKGPEFLW
jgi:serine/threonine-protein kinase